MQETLTSAVLFFLFSSLISLALGGNLLVCIAVYWDRNLRRQRENLFLVSLAVSDLLVSILVMTFAAANDLLGYWPFGSVYCQLWVCFDIACCSASILNLCAIALDRYWHISRPMTYVRVASRRRIFYAILVVWILSAAIGASPLAFGFVQREKNGDMGYVNSDETCELKLKPLYAIGSSTLSFFAPATVMVLLYTRLYLYARSHVRSIRTQIKQATSFLIMQLASERIREVTAATLHNNPPYSKSPSKNTSSIRLPPPSIQTADGKCLLTVSTIPPHPAPPRYTTNGNPAIKIGSKGSLLTSGVAKKLRQFVKRTSNDGETRRSSGASNGPGTNSAVSDQKARFTLGVIMGTFLICWLPFFCINILRSIYPDLVPIFVFQCVTWTGYANSTANPLIYSILNRDFRRAFKRIIMTIFRCCEKTKKFEANLRSASRNIMFEHQPSSSKSHNHLDYRSSVMINDHSELFIEDDSSFFPSPLPIIASSPNEEQPETFRYYSTVPRSQSSNLPSASLSKKSSFYSCKSSLQLLEDTSPLMNKDDEPHDGQKSNSTTPSETNTISTIEDHTEHFC